MAAGRSVRIFLVDGTPHGMRTAEVGNWTGKAVISPRVDLGKLAKRDEARRTGVYILFGHDESSPSGWRAYVGEGDEVHARIAAHDRDESKEFWTVVALFVSKDENLTKAHARWLESRLVRDIRLAGRCLLENGTDPVGGKLPEADVADLETYLENVHLLLPLVGFDVLRPEVKPAASLTPSKSLVLEFKWKDAFATCEVRDGGFVVKANSLTVSEDVESQAPGLRKLRKQLMSTGILVPVPGKPLLRVTSDYRFDSASYAAGLVAGCRLNGLISWKVSGAGGKTYKQWVEASAAE